MIFTSQDPVSSLLNECMAASFNQHWIGNVLVVKCGKKDPHRIVHMDIGEHVLARLIVGMLVYSAGSICQQSLMH